MSRLLVSRTGRALLLVGAAALAAGAFVNALANTVRVKQPKLALRLRPNDAVALALEADRLTVESGGARGTAVAIGKIARRALSSDPLTPSALRQLSVAAALSGDIDRATSFLRLAHRVTRREIGTLLMLINASVAAGDVPHALDYLDEALTANPLAANVLFPVIRADLDDAGLRAAFAHYVEADRPWMPKLLHYLLENESGNASNVAALVIKAGGLPETSEYIGLNGAVLGALVRINYFQLARRYLTLVISSQSPIVARRDRNDAREFGPFAWHYANTADFDARRLPGGIVVGRMAPSHVGTVAVKLLLLPVGRYSVTIPGAPSSDGALWELSCLPDRKAVIWTQGSSASFTVSPTCNAQELDLIARSRDFDELQIRTALPVIAKLPRFAQRGS